MFKLSEITNETISLAGFQIEDFRFDKKLIGTGSFGSVLKAENIKTNQIFAVKCVHLKLNESDEAVQFEIKILELLEKSPIKLTTFLKFYGYLKVVSISQTIFYLFFDYKPSNLAELIENRKQKKKRFSVRELKSFYTQLINGMAFLQTLNVCHRDMKPGNLLLDENEENLYIIDFGVSRNLDLDKKFPKELTVIGTECYFAPELREAFAQNLHKFQFDPFKSDVFSVGLLILKMATFRLPSKGVEKLQDQLKDFLDEFENNYRGSLKNDELEDFEIILKNVTLCLKLNPKKRPDFKELFQKNLNINDQSKMLMHIFLEQHKFSNENMNEFSVKFYNFFSQNNDTMNMLPGEKPELHEFFLQNPEKTVKILGLAQKKKEEVACEKLEFFFKEKIKINYKFIELFKNI